MMEQSRSRSLAGRCRTETVLDKRLDEAETQQFFHAAASMINRFRKEKKKGTAEDGWNLRLTVTAAAFKTSSAYDDQWDPPNGPPGFETMARIINGQ